MQGIAANVRADPDCAAGYDAEMGASHTVTFGIPLLARSHANNWRRVEHHLSATIASIYNQSNRNFRILLACTDRPSLRVPIDDRIEFLHCDFRPASPSYFLRIHDKLRRYLTIMDRHGELGGGYLMLTDADDLISRRLVDFVLNDSDPHGYLVDTGYAFRIDSGQLAAVPLAGWERPQFGFDKICGTCAVMNLAAADCEAKDLIVRGHLSWRERFSQAGRPLKPLPFRSVVYVRQSGENISDVDRSDERPNERQDQKNFMDKIAACAVERTPDLEEEFPLTLAERMPRWNSLAPLSAITRRSRR